MTASSVRIPNKVVEEKVEMVKLVVGGSTLPSFCLVRKLVY